MSRLIDADALKKEFPKDEDWEYPVNTNGYVCEKIDEQPTIEERKTGKWLVDEDGNMECPFCGNTCGFGNYCNECGADLRGDRNGIN